MKLMMKRKIVLRLLMMTVFLTLVWSCRNEDFAQAEKNPQRNSRDFFNHNKNESLYGRAGVDYIDLLESYNKEKDFLLHIPDQDGMPIWEKMKIVHGVKVTSLMIPLSTDDTTMSSIVFALIDNDGNNVKDVNNITNEELKRVVYSESYSTEEKEGLFTTFMMMDNYTFGNEAFTNIPKDLFVGYSKIGEMGNQLNFHAPQVKETDIKEQISENGKLQVVQDYVCAIVNHCTNHGPPPCDGCSVCRTVSCSHSTVFVYTYPDPGGSGVLFYGYGDEGGGGGTPAVIPDPDPCGMNKVFYRLAPGCSGNTEITEETLPPQTPCETMKQAKQNPKVNAAIEDLKTKTTQDKEFAYAIERKWNSSTQSYVFDAQLKTGQNFSTIVPYAGDYKGQAHSHPNNGQSIPSFGDVKWLRECKRDIFPQYAVAYNMVVCYNPASPNNTDSAIVYAITVDSANFPTLNTNVNSMWDRPDLQGKNDNEKREFLNDLYAKQFADVQNNSAGMEKKFLELYQDFGINLMRFNKDTQKWENLVLENNIVTPKPCE